MFGFNSGVTDNTNRVKQAADRSTYENIRHAAFSISKAAKALITKSKRPSSPGDPPTTRSKPGHNLRGAIFTNVERDNAIIGPRFSFVGESGRAHEFGEDIGDESFDERPFMEPALMSNINRFQSDWHGSIGE